MTVKVTVVALNFQCLLPSSCVGVCVGGWVRVCVGMCEHVSYNTRNHFKFALPCMYMYTHTYLLRISTTEKLFPHLIKVQGYGHVLIVQHKSGTGRVRTHRQMTRARIHISKSFWSQWQDVTRLCVCVQQ